MKGAAGWPCAGAEPDLRTDATDSARAACTASAARNRSRAERHTLAARLAVLRGRALRPTVVRAIPEGRCGAPPQGHPDARTEPVARTAAGGDHPPATPAGTRALHLVLGAAQQPLDVGAVPEEDDDRHRHRRPGHRPLEGRPEAAMLAGR